MSYELGRALLLSELVSPAALQGALFASVNDGTHLVRTLVSTGAIDEPALDELLSRVDAPLIRSVNPLAELVARLPPNLCARLLAVPVRLDPVTGTVDIAMVDVRDTHAARELHHHLAAPIRPLRAPLAALDDALRRGPRSKAPPPIAEVSHFPQRLSMPGIPSSLRPRQDTPPWGTQVHTPRLSEPPQNSISDIPIPLTRRHYAPVPGGTQRPPPMFDPGHDLPEAFAMDLPAEPAVERQLDHRLSRDSVLPASLYPARIAQYEYEGGPAPDSRLDGRPPPSLIPGPPPTMGRASYAPSVPGFPFGDASSALGALRAATDRDQALDILLVGTRAVARRVALFVVKRGGFVGWACTPEFGDRASLQSLLIPTSAASVLTTAMHEGLYLGAIRHDEVHAPLLRVMHGASRDVAAAAVRVAGRTALVLLADDLGDTMIATRRIEELARAAGDALSRILRAKR